MTDQWIVIPNWDEFQHYRDRTPPWIKLYTGLNSDDEWLALTRAMRGLLTTVWIEYARSRGQLQAKTVLALCDVGARYAHLESLRDAGFIALSASKPPKTTASLEVEVEEEKKSAGVRVREGKAAHTPAPTPNKGLLARFDAWVKYEGYEYVDDGDAFVDELRRRKFILDVKAPLAAELLERARGQVHA